MRFLACVYHLLLAIPRRICTRLFNYKILRRILFDIAEPDSLLISNGRIETFIVAASDKAIGGSVFINREPYDFDKVKAVVGLLDPNHKRTLLIDIGANIGTICVPAVKRGLFQRAIAIEPEPRNYSLLVANISINRLCDRIVPHNVALGQNNEESLTFELSADNFGDHRIRTNNNPGLFNEITRKTIEVKSETFNKVICDVDSSTTLIWIDTQGFEGYVLSGASNALNNQTPICLEFWPYGMARSGCYSLLKEALVNNGYKIFYNLEGSSTPVPLSSQTLDDLYNRLGEQGTYTDLLVM